MRNLKPPLNGRVSCLHKGFHTYGQGAGVKQHPHNIAKHLISVIEKTIKNKNTQHIQEHNVLKRITEKFKKCLDFLLKRDV